MKLAVRGTHPRTTADEATGLEGIARPETVLHQQPARADERAARQRNVTVERHRLTARHLEIELHVILEVFPHSRHPPAPGTPPGKRTPRDPGGSPPLPAAPVPARYRARRARPAPRAPRASAAW